MFSDKFLLSDVLATNLMLTGFLFFVHFLSFQDENTLDSWFLSFFHQSLTLISGVTRGLTLGGKLSWRGPTSQNSEKKLWNIVNLWMSWMSVPDKKTKTPRKTQKNNLKNTKYQNVNWRGPRFYIELARGKVALCPLSVKPLALMCVWLSLQTKEALFAALKLTFYVIYKRLLHLMAIFRSVLDSTRVLALYQVC